MGCSLQRLSDRPVNRAAMREMGELNGWALGRRLYHADDHCVGYFYLDFAADEENPLLLADVQARFDWILEHPSAQPIDIHRGQERWTLSDALFMSPPVWLKLAAATGDRAYLDVMDCEWWATADALFSAEEGLFYRDANPRPAGDEWPAGFLEPGKMAGCCPRRIRSGPSRCEQACAGSAIDRPGPDPSEQRRQRAARGDLGAIA